MQLMSGRLPQAVGVLTATAAAVVLLAGSIGYTEASRLVTGWRVMVPSSAFGFLCAGLGLIIAASLRANDRISARVALRAVALAMLVLPLATLLEYATGTRWGVELWLGATIPGASANAYAGRMSAMTSLSFVLLGIALAALTWRGRWAFGAVRVAGGTVLAVSWFAVLAISFDEARINNQPQFPGMAALTIVLFALSSYGVLAASIDVVTRVRDAGTDVALHAGLVVSAFALPLILGPLTEFSTRWLAPELSTALAALGFAAALTVVVWRGLARMQDLQQQRRAVLAELEERVLARTGELAHINLQLRQSEERLIEANRHKDEFLAMLSHELRNPLAPIRTGVELLKSPETTAGVRAEVHRVVERQMTHMIRLIDDLLDVSRINAGKLTLHLERLDLRDVVEQAVESTRHIVDRAGHDLRVIMPARAVLVEGDSTRLTQVASNLIQNACKYTPRGGRLSVEVRDAADCVELRVRDNGVGIPPEFLPRVFEKFEQLAPVTEDSQGGLGLGLALVRGIVTLHGGSVEAASEGAHKGSEFTVRLPQPPLSGIGMPAPELDTSATPTQARPPSRRVLVVDDNADNAAALAMLLRQLGHEVEVAGDGEVALACASSFRPDVILLDIGIPKLNGYDVCRQLRQHDWGRRIRVIAQTGFGEERDRLRSAEAGFDGHLVKPIDPARLDAVLQA
jgi:signal transduction histidine kinase/CheY-like chemotaxis protein